MSVLRSTPSPDSAPRSQRGRRNRWLAVMVCALVALTVPAAAHAGESAPGGLGHDAASSSGPLSDTADRCPTTKWYRKPEIVIHLTEFERANSSGLDELTMVSGIQDVVDQFNQMGGTSAGITKVTTSRVPFTFDTWYRDTNPTIHVGFATAAELADANASPQGSGVVGGATRPDPLLDADGCILENHIIFPDSATLPSNFATPFDTGPTPFKTAPSAGSLWFDAKTTDAGRNEDGTSRTRKNWFRPRFLHELLHAFGANHTLTHYSFMNYPTAYANTDKSSGGYPWANRPAADSVRPLPHDVALLRDLYPKADSDRDDVALFNTWYGPAEGDVDAAGSYPLCQPSLGATRSEDLDPVSCGVDGNVPGTNRVCPGDTLHTRVALANYSTGPVDVTARLYLSHDSEWQATDTVSTTTRTKDLDAAQSGLWTTTWKIPAFTPSTGAFPIIRIESTPKKAPSAPGAFPTTRVDGTATSTVDDVSSTRTRTDWIPLRGFLVLSSSC
jgi:hypothetical protein